MAPGALFEVGTRVKHFELIRELGRGGMGQVFLARDTRLGRLVALKFLGRHSPELIERFLVEARATAQCNHEHIIIVYEVDEWQGHPYMALEYLEGQSLAELLRAGPVSPRRAVELLVPVVRALVRAHELGIVHRDLKPENVFVTRAGAVKVLDFGVVKLFGDPAGTPPGGMAGGALGETGHGTLVGTMPYMSPEQLGTDTIDHRTDLWAVGIVFWKLLVGRHPLDPVTTQRLLSAAAMLDVPMPRIGEAMPELAVELEAIVDRCLAKRKDERFATASELLAALEPLAPERYGRRLAADESPYPGMSAFQEADAGRFFGRRRDIDHLLQRLREEALVGVVGPSGVGKSSFVRAGVVPALKASGEPWEVLIARPGRNPFAGLASLVQPGEAEAPPLLERLRAEPGYLGSLLRARARHKSERILLYIDQFEELYTLVGDPDERRAYVACLTGVADDASAPLRVVVSMRSDFLDRAAEDRSFMDHLARGLLFLPPVDRAGLTEALVQPLEMVGHRFESDAIVSDMVTALDGTPGALPLLQFTAAKLWDARDRRRRLLTRASYDAIGGIAGALATHADEVLRAMAPPPQRLTRAVLLRLVTSEGTRALADLAELRGLASDPSEIDALLDHLVAARLLMIQRRGEEDSPGVEIVHESLITSWPTLRRWREESGEDSAFLEQLRAAARQWELRGRPAGMLWTGEAMDEARRFQRRYQGELAAGERRYLDAVLELGTRSARRRRRWVAGAFAIMAGLIVAAAVALVWIRNAEQAAQDQKELAETEAGRARSAEHKVTEQLSTITEQIRTIERKETERVRAAQAAETASQVAEQATEEKKVGEQKLALTYDQLQAALQVAQRERSRAEGERRKAETAAEAERTAKQRAETLLVQERARVKELEDERRRLSTKLR